MNIRKGNDYDFEALLDLHLQLEDSEVIFDSNLRPHAFATEEGREKIRQGIQAKDFILLVCENEFGKVVGFVDGEIIDSSLVYYEKIASLNHICVDRNYRRRGIADMLYSAFVEEVLKQEAKYIRVLAFPQNKPAISFYQKHHLLEYSVYYQKKIQ